MTKSKSKIEQKAITKVRDLIDKIEFFKHDLKDTDKNISWDGTVEMYNGNTDIKENYDYTIDVQVKGRTTNNKKFSSKYRFPLDKIDLENYLKKDGTILIVCIFKKDENDYRLYYSNLLPYNIRAYLKEFSSNTIKINMKEIKDAEHFENICRNFKLDKEIQKGIKENIFNEDNLYSKDGKISKFYTWEKDTQNFNPQTLVGTWKYIYTLDKNGYTVNVSYGILSNLIESLNVKIYNKNKEKILLCTTTSIMFGTIYNIIIGFINIIILLIKSKDEVKEEELPKLEKIEVKTSERIMYAILFVGIFIVSYTSLVTNIIKDWNVWIKVIIIYLLQILCLTIPFRKNLKRDIKAFSLNKKRYFKEIAKTISLIIICYIPIAIILKLIIGESSNQEAIKDLPIWLTFILSIIIPPICEEIMFRGFLRKVLKNDIIFI